MIVLNLLPADQRQRLADHARLLRVSRSVIAVACILAFVVGILATAQYALVQRRDELQREIDGQSSSAYQPSARPLDVRLRELNTELAKLVAIQEDHQTWTPLVLDLTVLIPREMQLRSFTVSAIDRRLNISGVSPTRDTFLQFIQALEGTPVLTDIAYPISLLTEQSNLNFTVSATLTDAGVTRIHP